MGLSIDSVSKYTITGSKRTRMPNEIILPRRLKKTSDAPATVLTIVLALA